MLPYSFSFFFFFNDTATTEIYPLSLHDALPISSLLHDEAMPEPLALYVTSEVALGLSHLHAARDDRDLPRSEEHTSELQSQSNLVCRLLLEKKKIRILEEDRYNISYVIQSSPAS